MSRKKKPAYSLHKPSGQARVRINREDHYLGKYGSAESWERYHDLIAEWFANNGDASRYSLTVDDLALLYLEHATEHYRKNGESTSEIHCVRLALRHLVCLYGTTRAREFSPRLLKSVRQAMIGAGYVRNSINAHIGRIKRMFKWGVESEYFPIEVYQTLCTVTGLQKDRSKAKESEPVKPVDEAVVKDTLPHLPRPVAAMVELQLLSGARPGEITCMCPCDLTIGTNGIWTYRPASHKTEHCGCERRIFIGPKGPGPSASNCGRISNANQMPIVFPRRKQKQSEMRSDGRIGSHR